MDQSAVFSPVANEFSSGPANEPLTSDGFTTEVGSNLPIERLLSSGRVAVPHGAGVRKSGLSFGLAIGLGCVVSSLIWIAIIAEIVWLVRH